MATEAGKGDAPRSGADQAAYSDGWDRIFKKPMIVGVAVKTDKTVYSLPNPNRHHNVLRMMTNLYITRNYGTEVQGFVDDKGNFLNREDAYTLAKSNGQLKRISGPEFYQGNELYSEDLW